MLRFQFKLALLLAYIIVINARHVNLSEKQLQSVGIVLNSVLQSHVANDKIYKIFGTFSIDGDRANPDDFDISVDVDINDINSSGDGIRNKKFDSDFGIDVLNGIANGNGNDNGHNGNGNGNILLQIFNVPMEGIPSTAKTDGTTVSDGTTVIDETTVPDTTVIYETTTDYQETTTVPPP